MGIGAAVCAGISAIGAGISACCGAIGGALGGFLTSAVGILTGPVGILAMTAISGLSTLLGVSKKEEKPEELGRRMEKATDMGIKPDDFDSKQAYKDYLNKNIEITDEDKAMLKDETTKTQYAALGTGLNMATINEQLGMNISPQSYVDMHKMGMKPKEMETTLNEFKEKGVEPKIDDMLKGNLSISEGRKVESTLNSAIDKMDDKSDISKRLDEMLGEI